MHTNKLSDTPEIWSTSEMENLICLFFVGGQAQAAGWSSLHC